MDRADVVDRALHVDRQLELATGLDVARVELAAGTAGLRDRVRQVVAVRPRDRGTGLDGHVGWVELDRRDVDGHGLAAATALVRGRRRAGVGLLGRRGAGPITSVVIVVVAAGGDGQSETCDEENEKLFHAVQPTRPGAVRAGPSERGGGSPPGPTPPTATHTGLRRRSPRLRGPGDSGARSRRRRRAPG